jgi:hypothetical protein
MSATRERRAASYYLEEVDWPLTPPQPCRANLAAGGLSGPCWAFLLVTEGIILDDDCVPIAHSSPFVRHCWSIFATTEGSCT